MIVGSFVEKKPSSNTIDFVLNARDFQVEWSRCSLLANYIAKYMAYQFSRQEWAENMISTVTNDLLESVIKISRDQTNITIQCFQEGNDLILEVGHTIQADAQQSFEDFMELLCSQDIHELYFNLLTDSIRPVVLFNQVGLAMLVHDFKARIAARVDQDSGETYMQVCLPTKELVS